MKKQKIKIVFWGTNNFSLIILNKLFQEKFFNIQYIITKPDKKKDKKKNIQINEVKLFALENKIKLLQPNKLKNNNDLIKKLQSLNTDIFVVASFGKILPCEILNIPKFGCLNVHASLLPKYRGASPIQTSLLNNDKETGVTIMLMDEGMDTGDIIMQHKVKISKADTYISLEKKLAEIGSQLLINSIKNFINNKIKPKKQNNKEATYTKIITKSDGLINWTQTSNQIFNQFRAFILWPGIWTFFQNKIVKLKQVRPYPTKENLKLKPGQIFFTKDKKFLCGCGNNTILEILQIQLEGKKQTNAENFINGYQNWNLQFFKNEKCNKP